MKPNLYLLCGLGLAGKTTLAAQIVKELGCELVSLDDINASRGLQGGLGIPNEEWARSHEQALVLAETALRRGQDVVVDDTNCFRGLRDNFRSVAERAGAEATVILLDVPLEIALERLRSSMFSTSRPPITEAVLLELAQKFQYPDIDEKAPIVSADADPAHWVAANLRRR